MRTIAVYAFLVAGLRLFGKRELGQLNPLDFIVLLLLSNTVQNAIIGNDTSLSGGIVGAAALLAVNTLVVRYYYRGAKLEHRVRDNDEHPIRHYQVQEDVLRKYHINLGELTARAHERGFDELHEVEDAVLYPNGTIYMKGESRDSQRLEALVEEVRALRRELATRG